MFYQWWYVACGLQDFGVACGRGKWLVAARQTVTEIIAASCSRRLLVATTSNSCSMYPSRVPKIFNSIPFRSNGLQNVKCLRTEHTSHAEVPSDGSVKDKDGVSILIIQLPQGIDCQYCRKHWGATRRIDGWCGWSCAHNADDPVVSPSVPKSFAVAFQLPV